MVKEGKRTRREKKAKDQVARGSLKSEDPGRTVGEAKKKQQSAAAKPEAPALSEPERDCRAFRKDYELVDSKIIQRIKDIPPYSLPTICFDPELIKTPEGYYCLDGEELIQAALAEGTDIRCHVSYFEEISDIEMATSKVAFRNAPEGGKAIWAENVRNVEILFQLYADKENVSVPGHGGPRRGHVEDGKQNIRVLLAERMGKSLDTIAKLRTHVEYLDRPTLDALVAEKVDKKKFEEIQKVKRTLVEKLTFERKSPEEIIGQVSQAVLSMARDPKQIGEIWARLTQAPGEENVGVSQENARSAENGQGESGEVEEQDETEEFKDAGENADVEEPADVNGSAENEIKPPVPSTEDTVTKEDAMLQDRNIRTRGKELGRQFAEIFANEERTLPAEKTLLNGLIREMIRLVAEIPEATGSV